MNDLQRRMLLREALKRRGIGKPAPAASGWLDRIRARRFDKQRAFSDDPCKLKAALCTRRAGKTDNCAKDLYESAGEAPGTEQLFITLTRERAKDLLWDELKRQNEDLSIGAKFNEVELKARLPNGSSIKLAGADKPKEIEKRRGSKYRRVRVDESQAFGEYLKKLVEDVLEPATMDYDGDIALLGTPGPVCSGYFYEVTSGKAPGWTVHKWSVLDNPFVPNAREWLAKKMVDRGWNEDHPTYRREWLGEWVPDSGALFYRWDDARNTYDILPAHRWNYVLGWDLGFDDPHALVVLAYSEDDPCVYEVESWRQSGVTLDVVAAKVKQLQDRYGSFAWMVADTGGLGKALVEEMAQRHNLHFEAAQKRDKHAMVELLNADLISGRFKARPDSHLAREMAVLPKDPDDPKAEDPRFSNHCTDAGLYAFRRALHYRHEKKPAPILPGTSEWADKQAKDMEQSALDKVTRQAEGDWLDEWVG